MTIRDVFALGRMTAIKWNAHNAPRLAAALAYYTLLSLAPVVVLVIAIYGVAFSRTEAEQQLLTQAQQILGATGANAIKALTDNLHETRYGVTAAAIAGVLV